MKSKLLLYILPVLLVSFLFFGYSTQDDPSRETASDVVTTNTQAEYNSTIGMPPAEDNPAILYSQAELVSNPGGGFGGADASAITTPGTLFGFGNQILNGNRMADDFTIPAGQTWLIDSIIVFYYQTGSTTTSTINNISLQIWNGATPGTGAVVAGDSTTNRLGATYFSNIYRVTSTTLTNSTRPIMRCQVNMGGASLSAGTYWLDYAANGTLASGPWNPPRTIPNVPVTGNAYQRLGTTFAWAPAVDGTNAQGICFIVYGSNSTPSGGTVTIKKSKTTVIPENGGNANPALDTINISGIPAGNVIRKITVKMDSVLHSWIGDLRFWVSNANTVDTVISRIGWTGSGFGNSCDNLIGTRLIDTTGVLSVQNMTPTTCNTGLPANSAGNFTPKSPLGIFNNTNPNGAYILRVCDNAAGDTGSIRAWSISIDYGPPTSVSNNAGVIDGYKLNQNYPNPFNPSTTINYTIPKSGLVSMKVFDISGREVATLINEVKSAGSYDFNFNASNLSSGVYFYRLQAGAFVETKKMFLLK